MKILFLSAVLPYPPQSGGQVRIYKLLKAASRQHEITLFSFIREQKERQYLPKLDFCKKVEVFWRGRALQPRYILSSLVGKYPLLMTTYNNQLVRERISQELNRTNYDLIQIEPFYVFPSLPKFDLPLVIAEHNLEYEVYENYGRNYPVPILRPLIRFDAARLKSWEERIWTKANQIIAVSGEDKAVIRKRVGDLPISVIENGVDPELFTMQEPKIVQPPKFLFVGNFSWVPNQEAATRLLGDIWPVVKPVFPAGKLTIVGRKIPPRIRKLALASKVQLKENVSDIVSVYHEANIFLAPMAIGGGSKYKIIEAMACGLPVIATEAATAGLKVKENQHYLLAEEPQEYVKQVNRVLNERSLRLNMATAARHLIEEEYSWDILSAKLLKVWEEVYEKRTT